MTPSIKVMKLHVAPESCAFDADLAGHVHINLEQIGECAMINVTRE